MLHWPIKRTASGPPLALVLLPLAASLAVLHTGAVSTALVPESRGVPAAARALLAGLPPAFEPLPGPHGRAFGARQGNLALSVSAAETVVRLREGERKADVRFRLLGADPDARGAGKGLLSGRTHYLRGNRPEQWRRDVPRYEKVRFTAVYPGIDAVFYGGEEGLEYDFVVQPQAPPARLRIQVEGARATLDRAGDLVLETTAGELRQRRPRAYQEVNGRRTPVDAEWVLEGGASTLSFRLGEYDRTKPLVIDPVLVYSSFVGGRFDDREPEVAVDAQGAVYVALASGSDDLPLSTPAFQGDQAFGDVYIAKLDLTRAGASALVFGTYLGGDQSESVRGMSVTADGTVYTAGNTTSSDFPTTSTAFQVSRAAAPEDGFVTRLDPSGAALQYSTYLGGSSNDSLQALALDGSGHLYVCGETFSTDFPVKTPFQAQRLGSSAGFVAKLDTLQSGPSSLVYATYLGGPEGNNGLNGIAVDGPGRATVTGYSTSRSYPTTEGGFQRAPVGLNGGDSVLSRLTAGGTALDYSTYFGGTHLGGILLGSPADLGRAVALDGSGRAWMTGYTTARDLPVVGGFQATKGGADDPDDLDCFVARFNMDAAGTASLLYSSYLGGESDEFPRAIAVDAAGNAYVTGVTSSVLFPRTAQPLRPPSGVEATFITRVDPNRNGPASLRYSTPFGDPLHPSRGTDIAVDGAGIAYVVGSAAPLSTLPMTSNAFQSTALGGTDGFLIVLRPATPAAPASLEAAPLSHTVVRLTWRDRSHNETGFVIQLSTGGAFLTRRVVGRNVTSFIDLPPVPDRAFYRVLAVNEEGESPPSNFVRFEAIPPTPLLNLQAFGFGSSAVGLTWTDVRGEASYRVERRSLFGSTVFPSLPPNTTSFGDTSVNANSRYTYRVTALNGIGSSRAEATVTVLDAPVNLDVNPIFTSSSHLRIAWEDRSGTRETGFELQRRLGSSGIFTTVAQLGANVTSFLDSGLARSTTYTYRVRAVAPNSVSSFSNTDSASTGRIPAAPSLVQAQATGPDRVTVSWQDNSRFEAGFRVERRPRDGPFQAVGTVPPDATTFTDTGLEPRTPYRYRVFAFNDGGDSPSSNVPEVVTPGPVGGRLRVAPARLSFGVVLPGQTRARQLTVRNASRTEDLRVTARAGRGPFRVQEPAELLLRPGEKGVVKVRFEPASGGVVRGRLVLESTDRQRPTVQVPLTGWSYGLR